MDIRSISKYTSLLTFLNFFIAESQREQSQTAQQIFTSLESLIKINIIYNTRDILKKILTKLTGDV